MVEAHPPKDLILSVDYAQKWPLDDIMWPGPRPDWDTLISPELRDRLVAWAAFFNANIDWETGLFGSEERRRWYDVEGLQLMYDLQEALEGRFRVRLRLPR
ncbi:hypothetical protein JOE38_000190 [Clavibacter michiganensis]|uniref:hypothetical protein n=1 Tax=Clavibacter michiganensis TaxID=28447 RepID=UPI00195CA50B|nr:hypothetical protein [Clavibacter michiganensis]MBM7410367.1 hypothetical protein [Clavibacter michiganensis]